MNELKKYLDDPEIAGEPVPLREVHAIRLMMRDETKEFSPAELRLYYAESVKEAREKYGVPASQPADFEKKKIV